MGEQKRSYPCGGKPWFVRRILMGIVFIVAFILLFGFFVRILWNWLMPVIFGVAGISYVQAIGILILAHILFGGRGRHRFAGRRHGPGGWSWRHCSKEDVPNGEIKDWRNYDAWWEAEGREAFKKYIDSRGK